MEPLINFLPNKNNNFNFRILDCNVCLANALRRTIISDIPTVVFKTDKELNNILYKFDINTSRYNNEFLKQRLCCIPIHIKDFNTEIKDQLEFHIDLTNNTDTIQNVTTEHFKILDKNTNTFLDKSIVNKILPPNEITGDYILFAKLKPQINDEIPGEKLKFWIRPTIGTSKENACYNVISTCSYFQTPDEAKQLIEWEKIQDKLSSNPEINIEKEKINWYNLEAKRITIPNSFDFTIESVGVYNPQFIVFKACEILINKINECIRISKNNELQVNESETTMDNCYDIIFQDDFTPILGKLTTTLGKVFEYIGYELFYKEKNIISFICFKKIHPHDNHSILRITFKKENITDVETITKEFILIKFIDICYKSIEIFDKIYKSFSFDTI